MKAERNGPADDLLPAERKVLDSVGHLPLDFRAMWAVSNLFRSSTAIRRHMEANVLAPDRLSWTAFTGLWVLWIWDEMETRDFAAAVGISRPTATGVVTTLEGRGYVRRRKNEHLFPRFNAEEVAVTARLTGPEQQALAAMLRSMFRTVEAEGGELGSGASDG